ncbi:MAG: polysaccharide deacetylase family protein [Pseudomonadota bacterium]
MTFTPASLRWLETILEERYGLRLILSEEGHALNLALSGAEGYIRFDTLQPEFHQSRSDFPCGSWDAAAEGFVPVLGEPLPTPAMHELPARMVEQAGLDDVVIHYDILGLAYWMLTRLEEVGRTDLDSHQRFPATSSHAYQHGYLERPIVDEWLDLLGQVIKKQWAGGELKQHEFSIKVSHDVDRPSRYGFRPIKPLIRAMAGDVLKYRNVTGAMMAPWIRLTTKERLHKADPFNTFDWLMDVSEANGLESAFYFICGRSDPRKDADYEPEHPAIRHLMRRIHERGHEIGLHPSFNTYQSPELIRQEAERLKRICAEEGIEQKVWGGRMHYLRWEQPTTLRLWEEASMNYDSTLGYADRPGFRCGTCHEYPAFDPVNQEQLKLRIRPLVVMECTVLSPKYLGLKTEQAMSKFMFLKQKCKAVSGCYTLLWHNSELLVDGAKSFYIEVLRDSAY